MNLQTPNLPNQPALPEIRDIAAPVDVFPWPLWMVLVAGFLVLVILGLLGFVLVRYLSRRPPPPPPTPRQIAIQELEALRLVVQSMTPYDFSVRVSDVLRAYIAAQFRLKVTKQTSPEFLASISLAPEFSDADRELLAQFLERCDLIKFAHVDATSADSNLLLERAIAFVHGRQP